MKVASLLPSATEIAVALGLGDNLVGRSHECDFPPEVQRLPVCTATKLEKGLRSLEIDRRVQEIVRQGLSVYEVHADLLRSLKPDVILTQTQCAICAVTPADLEESLRAWTGAQPELVSLAPDTMDDVWGDIRRVGAATGRTAQAERLVTDLQTSLDQIRAAGRQLPHRPRVAAIEWFDPLMGAGNWIPELVEIAGGEPVLAAAGQHSPMLEWDALVEADPDILVLMPCGYQIPQSIADIQAVSGEPRWRALRAVANGNVFIADGHHFFNRPGPRLVESAQILWETFAAMTSRSNEGDGWIRWSPGA